MKAISVVFILLLYSCTPCTHKNVYANCSRYQILYGQGFGQHFENIYDYEIKGNCAIIVEGDCCERCGDVIGFSQRTICGNFSIRNHIYCR